MISLINKAFPEYGPYMLLLIIFLFSVLQSLIQIVVQLLFSNKANKQLEVYKIITGGNLNRKTRFIEKEYVALSECWSSFTKAYDNIKYADTRSIPTYDFSRMEDEKLEILLREYKFSNDQISEMKVSHNKEDLFFKINKKNYYKDCEKLVENFKDTLFANEIFMEEELFKKFDHFLAISQDALWGLRLRNMSNELPTIEKAQRLLSLPLEAQTIQERKELLLLVKESLQKDDSVAGKQKTFQRIAGNKGKG